MKRRTSIHNALFENDKCLKTSMTFAIRFSECDAMGVVWHGSYPLYLEDARERFGREYGLTYQGYIDHGVYAPIVDMQLHYRRPLRYGDQPRIEIFYRPTDAAKVVFDYEIRDNTSNELIATAQTVQVFMDLNYQLLWDNPPFYEEWKKRWQQLLTSNS